MNLIFPKNKWKWLGIEASKHDAERQSNSIERTSRNEKICVFAWAHNFCSIHSRFLMRFAFYRICTMNTTWQNSRLPSGVCCNAKRSLVANPISVCTQAYICNRKWARTILYAIFAFTWPDSNSLVYVHAKNHRIKYHSGFILEMKVCASDCLAWAYTCFSRDFLI